MSKPVLTETIKLTPWDIAESWYDPEDIYHSIQQSGDMEKVPVNVHGSAFARWLTHQYRLAMSKGIQLGRDESS